MNDNDLDNGYSVINTFIVALNMSEYLYSFYENKNLNTFDTKRCRLSHHKVGAILDENTLCHKVWYCKPLYSIFDNL